VTNDVGSSTYVFLLTRAGKWQRNYIYKKNNVNKKQLTSLANYNVLLHTTVVWEHFCRELSVN
jgi:hypothetical protein